jgi:L-seryl-tRNA(Ser) seleniumtransferase
MPNPLRHFPSIHELLESPTLGALINRVSHSTLAAAAGTVLDEVRREVQTAAAEKSFPNISDLAERIATRIAENDHPLPRSTINATGVLLHPRLGSTPLADDAVAEMASVARDYTNVDLDAGDNRSSQRLRVVEDLLRELTGAEAAIVLPSKPAAAMLALGSLAAGGEVIVARSQLLEGDDGCRLSDVMAAAGATLREVGAANSVRPDDYAQAISEKTAALMLVQPSTCVVVGSAGEVGLRALVEVARRKLTVIHDIGYGGLFDAATFGFCGEPTVGESIRDGADLVLLSGDKLLGGPSCGIVVGRRVLLEKIQRHPMANAMQADKLTLAALAATLRLCRDPERAKMTIPLLQLLTTSVDNLKNRAERLAPQAAAAPAIAEAQAVAGEGNLVGGMLPNRQLPTWRLSLRPATMTVESLATALREGDPSIVGRSQGDRLLLDLRSVFPRQDVAIIDALEALSPPNSANSKT